MSRRFPVKNGIDKTSGRLTVIMIAKFLHKTLIDVAIIFFHFVYISNAYNHFVQRMTKRSWHLFHRDIGSPFFLVVSSVIRIKKDWLFRRQKFKENAGVIRN